MPRDVVWPSDGKAARLLAGRFYSEPIKCMACAAAESAQEKYHAGEHDPYGIHFVIMDGDDDEEE